MQIALSIATYTGNGNDLSEVCPQIDSFDCNNGIYVVDTEMGSAPILLLSL